MLLAKIVRKSATERTVFVRGCRSNAYSTPPSGHFAPRPSNTSEIHWYVRVYYGIFVRIPLALQTHNMPNIYIPYVFIHFKYNIWPFVRQCQFPRCCCCCVSANAFVPF